MSMVDVVRRLEQGFESSSLVTEEWRAFYRLFKREVTKEIGSAGGIGLIMSRGHFYASGFFTAPSGQAWYFSISDVRWFGERQMLVRTAESYTDYTGGGNQYVPLIGMKEAIERMIQ